MKPKYFRYCKDIIWAVYQDSSFGATNNHTAWVETAGQVGLEFFKKSEYKPTTIHHMRKHKGFKFLKPHKLAPNSTVNE